MPRLPTVDYLSLSLHRLSLSEHLTRLHIGGEAAISECLFWPKVQTKVPYWPKLEYVNVKYSMCTVDGDWFFRKDPHYDAEEEEDVIISTGSSSDTDSFDSEGRKYNFDPHGADRYSQKCAARGMNDLPIRRHRKLANTDRLNS